MNRHIKFIDPIPIITEDGESYLNSKYIICRKISSSMFSFVHSAYNIKNQIHVAIKTVYRELNNTDNISIRRNLSIDNEIKISKMVYHPNIITFYEIVDLDRSVHIIMKLYQNGTFEDLIYNKGFYKSQSLPNNKSFNLTEGEIQYWMIQLREGIRYLRSHNILHLDLKPSNLLIDDKVLKICDFGFSEYIENDNDIYTNISRGSPYYMAPEFFIRSDLISTAPQIKIDSKTDLWSIGIIFFESLYGCTPYDSTHGDKKQFLYMIKNKPISITSSDEKGEFISFQCKDLMLSLLKRDPKDRIDWVQFYNHPWWEYLICGEWGTGFQFKNTKISLYSSKGDKYQADLSAETGNDRNQADLSAKVGTPLCIHKYKKTENVKSSEEIRSNSSEIIFEQIDNDRIIFPDPTSEIEFNGLLDSHRGLYSKTEIRSRVTSHPCNSINLNHSIKTKKHNCEQLKTTTYEDTDLIKIYLKIFDNFDHKTHKSDLPKPIFQTNIIDDYLH